MAETNGPNLGSFALSDRIERIFYMAVNTACMRPDLSHPLLL